jgi:DNA modification methylase
MREMEAGSVQTCVTSPPYFGLRDYGHDGQIGLEPTPDDFVQAMVEVFREVRRVLRDDGTVWLNLGDSYNASPGQRKVTDKAGPKQASDAGSIGAPSRSVEGLKPKDLIGIPWMVAFALRADGWYLRQDIIWHKPNPMPESVTDRCTKAHEYIFLLTKGPRYYFDAKAISEPAIHAGAVVKNNDGKNGQMGDFGATRGGFLKEGGVTVGDTRNKRSVWTVNSQPFPDAHFATYPPDLIEPCVLAGCPVGGTVLDPFGGAGTTGLVADRNGRNAVLCELNPEYAAMAERRLSADGGMFASVTVAA